MRLFPLKIIAGYSSRRIVLADKRSTPFMNGVPSRKWLYLFLKRNPELTFGKASRRNNNRKRLNYEIIYSKMVPRIVMNIILFLL